MAQFKTDLVIGAKTRGFEQVQQQTARLNSTAKKSLTEQIKGFSEQNKLYKEAQKEVKGLERQMQQLARSQLDITRSLSRTEKGTEAYKKLQAQLKGVGAEARIVRDTLANLDRAFMKQTQARGGFIQGFAQAAIPGAGLLQRGPGMWRQMAGTMAGSSLRQMAGGAAKSPFTGLSGMVQAASAIPFIGGAISAPISQVMGLAQRGLDLRRLEMDAAPFLGGVGGRVTGGGVKRRSLDAALAAGNAARSKALGSVTDDDVGARYRQLLSRDMQGLPGYGWGGNIKDELERVRGGRLRAEARSQVEREALARADIPGVMNAAQSASRSKARRVGFAPFETTGQQFGFTREETLQSLADMSRIAGGSGQELRQGGTASTLLAGARVGLGTDILGGFLGGARKGAMVGGDRADVALEKAFANAVRMGLDGSEVDAYLRDVASGVNSWKATGIPINEQALSSMGGALAASLGGVRGSTVASGLMGGVRGIASSGPQSALHLMAAQTFGGFQGGGLNNFLDSMINLEKFQLGGKNLGGKQVQEFIKKISTSSGGGAAGALTVHAALKSLGADVSLEEASLLSKQAMGESLSQTDRTKLKKFSKERARGQADAGLTLQQRAAAITPGEIKRQTGISDTKLRTGEGAVDATLNLEEATSTTANQLVNTFGGALTDATDMINKVSSAFSTLLDKLGNFQVSFE